MYTGKNVMAPLSEFTVIERKFDTNGVEQDPLMFAETTPPKEDKMFLNRDAIRAVRAGTMPVPEGWENLFNAGSTAVQTDALAAGANMHHMREGLSRLLRRDAQNTVTASVWDVPGVRKIYKAATGAKIIKVDIQVFADMSVAHVAELLLDGAQIELTHEPYIIGTGIWGRMMDKCGKLVDSVSQGVMKLCHSGRVVPRTRNELKLYLTEPQMKAGEPFGGSKQQIAADIQRRIMSTRSIHGVTNVGQDAKKKEVRTLEEVERVGPIAKQFDIAIDDRAALEFAGWISKPLHDGLTNLQGHDIKDLYPDMVTLNVASNSSANITGSASFNVQPKVFDNGDVGASDASYCFPEKSALNTRPNTTIIADCSGYTTTISTASAISAAHASITAAAQNNSLTITTGQINKPRTGLINQDLIGVNPLDPYLDYKVRLAIYKECADNPWYFHNVVAKAVVIKDNDPPREYHNQWSGNPTITNKDKST